MIKKCTLVHRYSFSASQHLIPKIHFLWTNPTASNRVAGVHSTSHTKTGGWQKMDFSLCDGPRALVLQGYCVYVLCLTDPQRGGAGRSSSNWEHLASVPGYLARLSSPWGLLFAFVNHSSCSRLLPALVGPHHAMLPSVFELLSFGFALTTCTTYHSTHPCTLTHHWYWFSHPIALFIVCNI